MEQVKKDEVCNLYRSGWMPEDIADELGLDELEVMDICEEELMAFNDRLDN